MAIACKIDPVGVLGIPGGYTRVNYIQNTGTQWIDTDQNGKGIYLDGLSARYDISLRTHIQIITSVNWPNAFFAARIEYNTGAVLYCGNQQGLNGTYKGIFYTQSNSGVVRSYTNQITSSEEPNIILLSNVDDIKIDSLTGKRTATGGSYFANDSQSGAVRFFRNIARNSGSGSNPSIVNSGDLYRCVIKRNGVEIANLVPCLDSNGRPCLFDLVSRNTYYNSGSGEFLWG